MIVPFLSLLTINLHEVISDILFLADPASFFQIFDLLGERFECALLIGSFHHHLSDLELLVKLAPHALVLWIDLSIRAVVIQLVFFAELSS